jgi:hypothetical protein
VLQIRLQNEPVTRRMPMALSAGEITTTRVPFSSERMPRSFGAAEAAVTSTRTIRTGALAAFAATSIPAARSACEMRSEERASPTATATLRAAGGCTGASCDTTMP